MSESRMEISVEVRSYATVEERDPEVIEDLAKVFEDRLRDGLYKVRQSIMAIEDEARNTTVTLATGGGSGGLIRALGRLFKMDAASKAEEKLRDMEMVKHVTSLMENISQNFYQEYDLYRQSVGALNSTLNNHPPYIDFLQALDLAADRRNISRAEMSAILHDPFAQADDVKALRKELEAVIASPEIKPLFTDVELRYAAVNRMVSDVSNGIDILGKKGVDMSDFRPLSDLSERMAQFVDKPIVSRPGGVQMDAPENSMAVSMKKIAQNIRDMIERLVARFQSAFSPAGASP